MLKRLILMGLLCTFALGGEPNEIIIKFKGEKPTHAIRSALQATVGWAETIQLPADILLSETLGPRSPLGSETSFLDNTAIYEITSSQNLESILDQLKKRDDIEYVVPNARFELLGFIPNDALYASYQQSLYQEYDMESAWTIGSGNATLTVAVLDSGIDSSHEDFTVSHIVLGYNYINLGSPPNDDNGHGTHVAGIIGATMQNATGIAGIAPNIRLFINKVTDSGGTGSLADLSKAILSAITANAKVINMSLGFFDSYGNNYYVEGPLQSAIDAAYDAGIVMVVAAGNKGTSAVNRDLDDRRLSPVCNDGGTNKILGVAALNSDKTKAFFSNYGSQYVDISAFGVSIPSLRGSGTSMTTSYVGGNTLYIYADGTSMAAPMVSGLAALLLSIDPYLSPSGVQSYIKDNATNIDSLNPAYSGELGAGLMNAYYALLSLTNPPTSNNTDERVLSFYNYPNPVENSLSQPHSTSFYLVLSTLATAVRLKVYSISGKLVYTHDGYDVYNTDSIYQGIGYNIYHWALTDNGGFALPSGIYIAIAEAETTAGTSLKKACKVVIK